MYVVQYFLNFDGVSNNFVDNGLVFVGCLVVDVIFSDQNFVVSLVTLQIHVYNRTFMLGFLLSYGHFVNTDSAEISVFFY